MTSEPPVADRAADPLTPGAAVSATAGGALAGPTWTGEDPPPVSRALGIADWLRVVRRGLPFGIAVYGGLVVLLAMRLIERPICGAARPMTQAWARHVCRLSIALMGIGYRRQGRPMRQRGAVVANHASWLDIFALNACQNVFFVAKSEVAAWPGIGWLARATGTLFVKRDRREAQAQAREFEARFRMGHHLMFFPEGTSTDSLRVLPFKSTLFQAFFAEGLREIMHVQPVSLRYVAPEGEDPRFYGWWGSMGFGAHLLQVLAQKRQGRIEVVFHDPLVVAEFGARKALCQAAEMAVRSGVLSKGATSERQA